MISAQCELMEAETVQGKPLNAIAYGTLTGHLTRTPNALCLKREPVDVTPVLNEYLSYCRPRLRISSPPRTRVRADGLCEAGSKAPLARPCLAMVFNLSRGS